MKLDLLKGVSLGSLVTGSLVVSLVLLYLGVIGAVVAMGVFSSFFVVSLFLRRSILRDNHRLDSEARTVENDVKRKSEELSKSIRSYMQTAD